MNMLNYSLPKNAPFPKLKFVNFSITTLFCSNCARNKSLIEINPDSFWSSTKPTPNGGCS